MANKYVFVRIRKSDFEKMMREKKQPIERDLKKLTGKDIKIPNTQLFKIAAHSTWDFDTTFANKMFKLIKIPKNKK